MIPLETGTDLRPAPPELVAMAEAAVREFGTQCFWFWHPDHEIQFMGDIRYVVENLREYGNRKAWKTAQNLQRCL